MSMFPTEVATLCEDAPSRHGRGFSTGKRFAHGAWPREADDEGANWKALWAPGRARSAWSDALKDRLAPARMGDGAAALYANFGAGRSAALAALAKRIRDSELRIPRTVAALRICGRRNGVADAPPFFLLRVRGRDPSPDRQLRSRFRKMARGACGSIGAEILASDSVACAWPKVFRPTSSGFCEGVLPEGLLRQFIPQDSAGLVIYRLLSGRISGWGGAGMGLFPPPRP